MADDKKERTEAMAERAIEVFDSGLGCAEAIAIVGMEALGRKSELIPRIATGFAGGVCRTQSFCGALAGGVLVLGVAYGRNRAQDDRSLLMAKVQSLVKGFRERFGSDNCFALTGVDFNQEGMMDVYRERIHAQCRAYVEHVARQLGGMVPEAE